MIKERLRRLWSGMIYRTCNPKHKDFYYYSKLGVCEEWKDYENFKNWAIKNGYNDNLSIDRIDNDKGYSPENCHFIPFKENCRKQKKAIRVEGKTFIEIAEENGVKKSLIKDRYKSGDRTIEELLKPRKSGKRWK